MKCLYCHEVIDPLGKFCPKCGLPLSEDVTLQGAGLPGGGSSGQWVSGAKPLIALVVASAIGAFVGVSAGWLGARMGSQTDAQAQARATPAASPAQSAPASLPVAAPSVDSQASVVTTPSSDPVSSTPESAAPADLSVAEASPKPVTASLLSTHQFDGVWAGDKPKQRVQRLTYTPPPDPLPPPTPLAMNPFKQHEPQYVMWYWLGPTADLYGNGGPGPAEKDSQGSQYFDGQF